MNRHAVALALASAALFGVSTPAAKSLLGEISPTVLAGLFYCGAGIGIAVLRLLRANADSGATLGRTWSTPKEVVRLEVGIAIEEDCNGEEEAQAGRDRCEVAAG
jgi:hypothetical protein